MSFQSIEYLNWISITPKILTVLVQGTFIHTAFSDYCPWSTDEIHWNQGMFTKNVYVHKASFEGFFHFCLQILNESSPQKVQNLPMNETFIFPDENISFYRYSTQWHGFFLPLVIHGVQDIITVIFCSFIINAFSNSVLVDITTTIFCFW